MLLCRCFGVPLCALLGLRLKLSVHGFWLGLLCTSYSMSVVQLILISRFNWQQEVDRAAALMAEHEKEQADANAAAFAAVPAGCGHGVNDLGAAEHGSARLRGIDKVHASKHTSSDVGLRNTGDDGDGETVVLLANHRSADSSLSIKNQHQLSHCCDQVQQQHARPPATDIVSCPGSGQLHCATHFMQQQAQHCILHQASLQRALLQSCDSIDRS